MLLLPPPYQDYATRNDLVQSIQAWAANKGYTVVIARSDGQKITFKCNKGGSYQNRKNFTDNARRQWTGSQLINCPFLARATFRYGLWQLQVHTANHNHGFSSSITQHPSFCRFTANQHEYITSLSNASANPHTILGAMQSDLQPGQAIIAQDVYNTRVQLWTNALAGQTPIQALFDQLDHDFFSVQGS